MYGLCRLYNENAASRDHEFCVNAISNDKWDIIYKSGARDDNNLTGGTRYQPMVRRSSQDRSTVPVPLFSGRILIGVRQTFLGNFLGNHIIGFVDCPVFYAIHFVRWTIINKQTRYEIFSRISVILQGVDCQAEKYCRANSSSLCMKPEHFFWDYIWTPKKISSSNVYLFFSVSICFMGKNDMCVSSLHTLMWWGCHRKYPRNSLINWPCIDNCLIF